MHSLTFRALHKFSLALFLLLLFLHSPESKAAFRVIETQKGSGAWKVQSVVQSDGSDLGKSKRRLLRSGPLYIAHDIIDLTASFKEWEVAEEELSAELKAMVEPELRLQATSEIEVREILVQGPTENRINLTIIAEGYRADEKARFFEDAEFITDGLFESKAFSSYLPLFNVYAIFVPSNESGIGDGRPKDTAFRLYRDPVGSKRGILPGDERALARAERLAPASDYPIVLANDDYYGGLGGRWAITTRSRTSGLKVLRHELGHNFGEVGEEYDNGYVYRGANSSRTSNVPWRHWIENELQVHEATLLSGDYVWQNLENRSYKKNFRLPSNAYHLSFEISSVGWSQEEEVEFLLNGRKVDLTGSFFRDRNFYTVNFEGPFSQSNQELEIREKVKDGDNVLGFALAYSFPQDYNFEKDFVGAFASYNTWGSKFYRPTHKSCLMRDMNLDHFCSVDKENFWEKFLERISLIDSLSSQHAVDGSYSVELKTLKLSDLEIRWFSQEGDEWKELEAFRGAQRIDLDGPGKFKVEVALKSPEVRKTSRHFIDSETFEMR